MKVVGSIEKKETVGEADIELVSDYIKGIDEKLHANINKLAKPMVKKVWSIVYNSFSFLVGSILRSSIHWSEAVPLPQRRHRR